MKKPLLQTKGKPLKLLSNFVLAFSFLTVIPIPLKEVDAKEGLARSMFFFPVVGFLIGLLALILVSLFGKFFPRHLSHLFLVLLPILLSGGLHVDGLADSFDAFFQGRNKEDLLRVMKDSRIGVWGALSILFLVLFKWEFLNVLSRGGAFLLAMTLSRWAHVLISYLLPSARAEKGLGKQVAGLVAKKELLGATLFTFVVSVFLGLVGFFTFLLSGFFVFLLSRFYQKKIDGVTGDVIGATGELTEVFAYFVMVILYGTF